MVQTFSLYRWRRAIAAGMGTAMILASTPASAQLTHYTDVQAGAWFEESAEALLRSGALDANESRLRPNDLATRAESMKLLVNVYGEDLAYPAQSSFNDVSTTAWYFPYVEAAARAGWIKGDRNCYETGVRPCYARPADNVNRAEMAIILQRAYNLAHLDTAPIFSDNARGEWYYVPIQTAADHCILQGDGGTGRVRPGAFMNRAEMVVMFDRASRDQQYGQECGETEDLGNIVSVTTVSSQRVRVSFNVDLNTNRIDDIARYTLERVGGNEIAIDSLTVINTRIVELNLETALDGNVTYRLSVDSMLTSGNVLFNDTQTFVFGEANAALEDITVIDSDSLRVSFNVDLDADRANDDFRYIVERSSGGGTISVDSATVINDRTVDLNLDTSLVAGTSYRLRVENMLTDDNQGFSDDMTFSSHAGTPMIENATTLTSTRIRLDFNTDLDEGRAEELVRYIVSGFRGDLDIDDVTLTDSDIVEIDLGDAMQAQEMYNVRVTNLLADGGSASFSDDISFVYGSGSSTVPFTALLKGTNEVPIVITLASGTGSFTLTASGLQYDISVRGMSGSLITGAHFHLGDTGVEGSVLETITFNGLRATGTWTDLTNEERAKLLDGDIYVNVHTAANPDGEIRGQVTR